MESTTWIWAPVLAAIIFWLLSTPSLKTPLPVINQRQRFEIGSLGSLKRFFKDAHGLIRTGFSQGSAFYLYSEFGPKIVLAPKHADDFRTQPALSLLDAIAEEFHAHIRGFDPFNQDPALVKDVLRTKLTPKLGEMFTDDPNWHDLQLKPNVASLISRLTSRVFLGEKLYRNPDWHRVTADYAVHTFMSALFLRMFPRCTRPYVAYILPFCRKIRNEIKEAEGIITPVVEERRSAKQEAIRQGKEPEHYEDAMQWMEECAKGRPYDPTLAQVALSLAAIHTTSDLLTQTIFYLAEREDVIKALRNEVIGVLQNDGWTKSTFNDLKLMDSVLKESQRLKPHSIAGMRRFAQEDVTLSDGTVLPKGTISVLTSESNWDPTIYPEPETFDAYRFLKLRETPGFETVAQAVTTSPQHLAFGLGKHACPGRFFAIALNKIILCHVLSEYDFKVADGWSPTVRKYGFIWQADPVAKVSVRRRKEEIIL
ncbi:cytochrome P450 [Aspergillus tubingensis]|uniref:cytochrome P450 n=1 Tax=Aspergillus tubingensis TaxID=5068 RepID=UPI0015794EFA|nr:cytochrome P450 [Aspergillus tubingensis]GFN19071.1 cytochrome P450 [Aspergillus tubingensis]